MHTQGKKHALHPFPPHRISDDRGDAQPDWLRYWLSPGCRFPTPGLWNPNLKKTRKKDKKVNVMTWYDIGIKLLTSFIVQLRLVDWYKYSLARLLAIKSILDRPIRAVTHISVVTQHPLRLQIPKRKHHRYYRSVVFLQRTCLVSSHGKLYKISLTQPNLYDCQVMSGDSGREQFGKSS